MKKEYWIIDTDASCPSLNTCDATGPYPSKKATESAALNDIRNVWDDSCACLKPEP